MIVEYVTKARQQMLPQLTKGQVAGTRLFTGAQFKQNK